jgi:hypothetical protein
VDPRDLTAGKLAALKTVRDYHLTRVKGGWRCPGSPTVTLATAQYFQIKRLAQQRYENGRLRLIVTGLGKNTLAVAEERGRKRH